MTGGGFGGCTISLIEASAVDKASQILTDGYRIAMGRDVDIFVCAPSDGAQPDPGLRRRAMASIEPLRGASHRRFNPLTGEWVLVSPHRAQRPWQGQRESKAAPAALAHDPNCYLCPGNLRVGGVRNPDYPHTFVFDNDFQALQADAPTHVESDGLLVAEGESGRCRVFCFSPRHDLTLAGMAVADIERVVDVWVEETIALGSLPDIASVQIFENRAR